VVRDNHVSDQPRCISFNRNSNFNEIYNNTVANCIDGFYLANTTNNSIHDNYAKNVTHAFVMKDLNNTINKNTVDGAGNGVVFTYRDNSNQSLNTTFDPVQRDNIYYENALKEMAMDNSFSNTANLTFIKILPTPNLTNIQNFDQENKTSLVLNFMEE
jgi:parallel beta-helix repeat protein